MAASFTALMKLFMLINLFTLIGWAVGIIQAWRGNYYSFPFAQALKERI